MHTAAELVVILSIHAAFKAVTVQPKESLPQRLTFDILIWEI